MYCVVQTGSRMLRLECGTTRSTFSCADAAPATMASTATRRLRSMRKSSGGNNASQVSTGMRESVRLPLAFFASGAAALLFEVLWFRALGRVLGNTVWAGALVLTAFMLGLALGGVLAAQRQAEHEGGQHQGSGPDRVAEHAAQGAEPQHLEEQRRRARREEGERQ